MRRADHSLLGKALLVLMIRSQTILPAVCICPFWTAPTSSLRVSLKRELYVPVVLNTENLVHHKIESGNEDCE